MTDRPALLDTSVMVRGRERSGRTVSLPEHASAIVFATEKNIDVTLEVSSAGRTLARGDSPVRRSGTQRVSLRSVAGGEYSIDVIGKEDAQGSVTLRVVLANDIDPCTQVQRRIAAADAEYALGQSVTRGAGNGANAQSAYKKAASRYQAVARQRAHAGQAALTAQVELASAAALYQDLHDYPEAYAWAERAARTHAALQDEYGRARAQALQATALLEIAVSQRAPPAGIGIPRASGEMLERARNLLGALADLHLRRGERYDQALALNNIGLAHYYAGALKEAIRAYQPALKLFASLGERTRQVIVLQNLALAEYELGHFSDAITRYNRVLQLITPAEEPGVYASVLDNSALANFGIGNIDLALRQYSDALELQQMHQSSLGEARSFHGLGAVYDAIGDRDLALDFYNQALRRRTAALDARGQTTLLRAIANILRDRGRTQDALRMHEDALALATAPGTRARIAIEIAKDLAATDRMGEACKQLEAVLKEYAAGDRVTLAKALLERSNCSLARGDFDRAAADLRSALRKFQVADAQMGAFQAWIAIARLERQRGARKESFAAVDRALALAEEIRLQSANPELRATLLQPLRPAFDLKISLLAEDYFGNGKGQARASAQSAALQALMTSEQARARALADFQMLDTTAPGIAADLLHRRQTIYRELASRRFQLNAILDGSAEGESIIPALRTEITELRGQLDEINARIAASGATASREQRNAPVAPDLRRIPADAAVIEYWLGPDDALAWVLTRGGVEMVRLGPSAELVEGAKSFHHALRGFGVVPKQERLRLGQALYELILAPLADHVRGKRTLLFAPDGALHYIPFAALRSSADGRTQFLVEEHDIAVTPSIAMLLAGKPAATRPRTKTMLLVSDPVYELSDLRLATLAGPPREAPKKSAIARLLAFRASAGGVPLSRLPGTAQEAANIAALLPRTSVDRLEGFDATRERFLQADLARYRFIHVASHAVSDSEVPQLSALVLSTLDRQGQPIDGRVLAADLMTRRLNADAVVLSACDTALGKNVSGEGLIGLRYVVLARGARAVVASLWQLPDQAGAELTSAFYRFLLTNKLSVTAALSEAMRTRLGGQLSDPALWGALAASVSTFGEPRDGT